MPPIIIGTKDYVQHEYTSTSLMPIEWVETVKNTPKHSCPVWTLGRATLVLQCEMYLALQALGCYATACIWHHLCGMG